MWRGLLKKEKGYVGLVSYETGTICLLPPEKYEEKADQKYIERVFFHELSHIIDEETRTISKREARVEEMSGIIHEFMLSRKGDLYADIR